MINIFLKFSIVNQSLKTTPIIDFESVKSLPLAPGITSIAAMNFGRIPGLPSESSLVWFFGKPPETHLEYLKDSRFSVPSYKTDQNQLFEKLFLPE